MTDTGARALAAAIVVQAIDDYIEYKSSNPHEVYTQQEKRRSIDRFFKTEWFKDLVYMGFGRDVDPDFIVLKTKQKAAAHDAKKARVKND